MLSSTMTRSARAPWALKFGRRYPGFSPSWSATWSSSGRRTPGRSATSWKRSPSPGRWRTGTVSTSQHRVRCGRARRPGATGVGNSLDRGQQAALWFIGSSVHLPQEPGRGSEMTSIPTAVPSGPWRQTAPPRAVLFSGWTGQGDPGGRGTAPAARRWLACRVRHASQRAEWIIGQDEFP